MIRHAALPVPVAAATLSMHLPSADTCLIPDASRPLIATPRFQRTFATAIDLTPVATAAHQRLTIAPGAKE